MTARGLLGEAIRAGAADLGRRRALLDRINVFPVVDADTGANLCRTAEALAEAIRAGADPGRAVLLGARGNSGVIFAEHVVGFLRALGPGEEPGAAELIAALERGAELARGAVAAPVEGTILTVMSALPGIVRSLGGVPDAAAHAELERRLAAVVADTPRLLPRLAEAGVVDAGALGFHVFACGLALVLPGLRDPDGALGAIRARRDGDTGAPLGGIAGRIFPRFLEDAARERELTARYCVDAVVELEREPPADFLRRLEAVGASVDVARSGAVLKLHAHGDRPELFRLEAGRLGRLLSFDAEDMAAGLVRARAPSTGIAAAGPAGAAGDRALRVVGDSSMSLSAALAARYGIERLENYVGSRGAMIRDGDLDTAALFERMRAKEAFTTAQASAAEARAFVDAQLARPGRVLYLAVGRPYTGTQDLVRAAAAGHPERDRFEILDTRAAAGQQGLAVLLTARRAAAAVAPEELAAYARRRIGECREYLVLETLEYLSRTGRVGRIRAALAGALSVRPIVGHGGDGAITWAKVRSREAAVLEVVRRVAGHPGEGRLVVLVEHTDNEDRLRDLREALERALPGDAEILTSPLSATSAVHMGPGTWGVAVARDDGR